MIIAGKYPSEDGGERGGGGGENGSDRFTTIKKHPRRNDEALHTRVGDVCVCINNAGTGRGETPMCIYRAYMHRARSRVCLRILPPPLYAPRPSIARAFVARSSALCARIRAGNWFMIEPRIQTRPIYILIRRRSQLATTRSRCPSVIMSPALLRTRYIRVTNAPRSGHDRTLFTAATRWPSFPARSPPCRPRTRITSLLLFSLFIVQWSCTCPRFYARCVQYAASFFLFFSSFSFPSLSLFASPRKLRYIALRYYA